MEETATKGFVRSNPRLSLCGLNCGLCPMNLSGRCSGCSAGSQSRRIAKHSVERGGVEYGFRCDHYTHIDAFDSFIMRCGCRRNNRPLLLLSGRSYNHNSGLRLSKKISRTASKIKSGDMRGGFAIFFRRESHFLEEKYLPCTICGQSFRRKLKQIVVGVAVAGELTPPSTNVILRFPRTRAFHPWQSRLSRSCGSPSRCGPACR